VKWEAWTDTTSAAHHNISGLYLDDLRDTAVVIANLDLVVSVDTAVAHLAASMGKPTWILIPAFGSDWRWQLERTDSPRYPSARLYRQPKVGDWASVIDRLRADITTMAARGRAA
jgi:ADP-heptose:LPS heptosyltransferase